MSCIVYISNKVTGVQYAYESTSYRDPVTKKPRTKRRYLGRVNPLDGSIIPKAEQGRRNRSPLNSSSENSSAALSEADTSLNDQISKLSIQVSQLSAQIEELLQFKCDATSIIQSLKTAFTNSNL